MIYIKSFTHVIKRDGSVVPFTPLRITNAIYRAANAAGGRDLKTAEELTRKVQTYLSKIKTDSGHPHVENIQDSIEKILIENGHAATAKAFILYRNERNQTRLDLEKLGKDYDTLGTIPWKKVWSSLNWSIDHKVLTIKQLNSRIRKGSFLDLVKESEEAYQLDIVRAADTILKRKKELKLVIIAGPSSSGKTTSTIKIAEHLKNEGFEFIPYHVDNYFFDLELHPLDEHGDYDYETPEAIDIKLLNQHLLDLISGKRIDPPFFNFKSGKREGTSAQVELKKNQVLLIDSLHGMHEPMTKGISENNKIKIYIEPFLQIRSMDGSYIRWTDIRLIRRLIRDQRERSILPIETIKHWHYVRRSELRYITPHSLTADYIINTSLPYELPIWKTFAGDIFKEWANKRSNSLNGFPQALHRAIRINNILKNVRKWDKLHRIPATALIREFIGGSSYEY